MGVNDHVKAKGKVRTRLAALPAPHGPTTTPTALDTLRVGPQPAVALAALDTAPAAPPSLADEVLQCLYQLSASGDGNQLRIIESDKGVIHIYYTYTHGPWRGHYVYWSCQNYELAKGLVGIHTKTTLVAAGQLRPTKDLRYPAQN